MDRMPWLHRDGHPLRSRACHLWVLAPEKPVLARRSVELVLVTASYPPPVIRRHHRRHVSASVSETARSGPGCALKDVSPGPKTIRDFDAWERERTRRSIQAREGRSPARAPMVPGGPLVNRDSADRGGDSRRAGDHCDPAPPPPPPASATLQTLSPRAAPPASPRSAADRWGHPGGRRPPPW